METKTTSLVDDDCAEIRHCLAQDIEADDFFKARRANDGQVDSFVQLDDLRPNKTEMLHKRPIELQNPNL